MKHVFHPADSRGHAQHGWLDSYHTFSFAGYYDPSRLHFGLLRVLNDDVVKGGMGFGRHPHDNMEIVSIPLRGALEHRDSTGGHGIIQSGEVQIMSAGSGIEHSEKNASHSEEVNFLQIWVFAKERDIQPRYDQRLFPKEDRINKLQTVVSPEKGGAALWINQDARFALGSLKKGFQTSWSLSGDGHGVYVFQIDGKSKVDGISINKRDGLGVWETKEISILAEEDSEVLLIEVPMN